MAKKEKILYLEKKITLTDEYFDTDREITFEGIANLCELYTMSHLSKLKMGKTKAKSLGLAWVVARQHIIKNANPQKYETVCVSTYPYKQKGMEYYRHFEIKNVNGDVTYAVCDQLWVLIDMTERTLVNNAEFVYPEKGIYITDDEIAINNPEFPELTQIGHYYGIKPDMDTNKHMHHAKYFPLINYMSGITDMDLKEVTILYHKEILLKDDIALLINKDKKKIYFEGRDGKKKVFNAILIKK